MSRANETVEVQVKDQILWIGSKAYPLQNITMADLKEWRLRRIPAVWSYLKSLLLCLAILVVAAVVNSALASSSSTLTALAGLAALVLFVVKTVRLVKILMSGILYRLVLQTSAGSHEALSSLDGDVMVRLVHQIMAAINNPHARFSMTIQQNDGDIYNVFGNDNIGHSVTHNK